ncbi:MAG TPA: hypothetical protein VMW79_06170 [Anaerolineae bacterium]|nr:hypothetical protein [Anaerolineae bacterium]HUW95980.1 hypothetical protein [Anaerolineae bacterium]
MWTAPRTWVAGELVTKAILDEQIRDNMLVLHAAARSSLPQPVEAVVGASAAIALAANNTTAHLGVIYVPRPITVASILYNIGAGGGATSAVRIALYTEDGQTRLINVTDVCGAGTGVRTVDVDPDLDVEVGNYIILICHSVYATSAKTITRYTYDITLQAHIATEPDLSGTLTIVGGAAPATVDPEAFTTVAGALIPVLRFLGVA